MSFSSLESQALGSVCVVKHRTEINIAVKMSAFSVRLENINMVEYLCSDSERTMIEVRSIIHISIDVCDYQKLSLAIEHHVLVSKPTAAHFHWPIPEMKASEHCLCSYGRLSPGPRHWPSSWKPLLERGHLKLKSCASYQECRPRYYFF